MENAREFVNWVTAEDGQAIIEAAGFFSREVNPTGANTNNYILFDFNRHAITDESRQDIGLYLQRFATRNPNVRRSGFVLKGYADSIGDEDYNMKLSKERADAVAEEFHRQGFSVKRVEYYGKRDPKRTTTRRRGGRSTGAWKSG